MRKVLLAFALTMALTMTAQESDFDQVFKACELAQSSMEDGQGSQSELTEACNLLKSAKWETWTAKPSDGKPGQIKGHLVFTPEFLTELIKGKEVYKWAKRYANQQSVAEQRGSEVKVQTVCVAKHSKLVYKLRAAGTMDAAVVAEINGLFNLTVKVQAADGSQKVYKVKSDEFKGAASRKLKGMKMGSGVASVTIEVENRGDADKSVAIIIK